MYPILSCKPFSVPEFLMHNSQFSIPMASLNAATPLHL